MAKVIIIGPGHPLRGGGLTTFNHRLAREFTAQGHDCQIYSFSLQYPSFLFPGKTQYSIDPAPASLNIKIKVNSVNPINWIKVGMELKRLQPELLIIKFWLPFMSPCFGTIARLTKKNGKTIHTKSYRIEKSKNKNIYYLQYFYLFFSFCFYHI